MSKLIVGAVVAVGLVSSAVGGGADAWSYNAVRATQVNQASVVATIMYGKNLPVENWEPAY